MLRLSRVAIAAVLQVSSATQAERVSGSALGGGTFAGLCRLLTGVKSFDEMLRLAAQGDNKKVRLRRMSSAQALTEQQAKCRELFLVPHCTHTSQCAADVGVLRGL